MSDQSEDMLQRAFQNLGADETQAKVMASQLLKRAQQIANDRGITEMSALAELLAKVVAGRRGEYGTPLLRAGDSAREPQA